MKNERGGIKILTIVGILLVIIVILFGIVVYEKIEKREENINTNSYQKQNTIGQGDKEEMANADSKEFSIKFLQLENESQNKIYSPLSIKYALKMLQEGAKNSTYNQIEKIIGDLKLPKYNNVDKKLSLANGLYIRDTYSEYVKKEFINTLQNKYSAEVKYDKFQSAKNVNDWIDKKTFGIIKNMLSDNLVQNPDTQMLLINALAIDLEWDEKFDFNDTYGKEFTKEDGTKINATTMYQKTASDDISYYLGEDVTALTMALEEEEDTELEFMAIMPKGNLKEYVSNLKMEDIDKITKKLKSSSNEKNGIEINIPKFSFEYDLKLKQDLINLGITDAFDKDLADFSNMADIQKSQKNMYVGDALHKANIDFSEKGVKAAAVTVMAMMDVVAIMPQDPIIVDFDRPFLFLIRDKETNEVWFTGTVYEPNLWENDREEYMSRY